MHVIDIKKFNYLFTSNEIEIFFRSGFNLLILLTSDWEVHFIDVNELKLFNYWPVIYTKLIIGMFFKVYPFFYQSKNF
jgi:hypothetical protein